MEDERLWAPWRLAYLQGDKPQGPTPEELARLRPGADADCFLCRAAVAADDRANLVVARGSSALVMLNRYPYNNGHLMVAPLDHHGRFEQIDATTHAEITTLISRGVLAIEQALRAEGVNVGLNLGRAAGAGVPGHLHWHIVPRWFGDTNFMTAVADLRVISASLDAMCEVLSAAIKPPETGS
ncbi:MAG: HIT domain-containing protein [Planctomycetes bacterium]|nr:HIT domain-containing protein [Planctomycetota bacterium]